MTLVADTGVFSASLSRRPRPRFDAQVTRMLGQQVFLASATVAELRYGAMVAGWGPERRRRLEASIAATTVIPVSDALLTTVARLRYQCRATGHPLHESAHANDLWIAASAVHLDVPLLTADRIFMGAPGLDLVA